MRAAAVVVLIVSVAALPGCRMNERLSGTVFGGLGGLTIGALAGSVGGALVGGGIGALAGYLIGDYIADRRECGRKQVFCEEPCGQVGGIKEEEPHVRLAREAYERGRAAKTAPEAERLYLRSYDLNPSPAPLNMLALNALFRGERALAEHYWNQALTLDPDYTLARHNLEKLRREQLAPVGASR